jgi:hydroxymethylpyrimidine pyrophosphatase-like HAD family hydrolase
MRYMALAAGFDGTLARNGRCEARCVDALRALAASGRKLILVTKRELREVLEIFPEAGVFDYLVAESGGVMHRTATRESTILAHAPPEIFVQELRRRGVTPLTVGSSIITTICAHEGEVAAAIRKLQLDCELVRHEDALIILPGGVSEASGVQAALEELGLSAHNLVAVGNATSHLPLFDLAEHAVAVQNADPLLKRSADRTTQDVNGEGFIRFAHDLLATDLAAAPSRHRIVLGLLENQQEATIAPVEASLLVCGPDGSGKAAMCSKLLDQLVRHRYQCCVIGMNGQHAVPASVEVFGDVQEPPQLGDILSAMEKPANSIAVNLAALSAAEMPTFANSLLLQLHALHDRTGRPHTIVVNEADCILDDSSAISLPDRTADATMIYSSSAPAQLPREILRSVQTVVALGSPWTVLDEVRRATDQRPLAPGDAPLLADQALLWAQQDDVPPVKLRYTGAPRNNGAQHRDLRTECA